MRLKQFIFGTFFAVTATCAVAANLNSVKQDYLKTGQSIVDMVNRGDVDTDSVRASVIELTRDSVLLAQEYLVKYPEGKALITEVINEVASLDASGNVTGLGPMAEDSFDYMEKHWHDLGFMEGKSYGIDMEDEDNEHFTDPLHVMIHPIMVFRAAQDKNLDAMKAEMQEGMEQIEITVNAM